MGSDFTESEYEHFSTTSRVAASFSTLGSLIIIILFFKTPGDISLHYQCVFWMSVADFIGNIAYLMGADVLENDFLCTLQALLSQLTLASVLWGGIIGVDLILAVTGMTPSEQMAHYIWYYHVCAWIYPLITMILMLSTNVVGDASTWCWIDPDYPGLRFAFWYIPVWIAIAISCVSLYIIHNAVKEIMEASTMKTFLRKVMTFTVAFLIVNIPGTVHRLYNLITDDDTYVLSLIHAFFAPIQGFVNFLVYVGPLLYQHVRIYFMPNEKRGSAIRKEGDFFTLSKVTYTMHDQVELCEMEGSTSNEDIGGGTANYDFKH